jgi:putative hydrolase of the HAD superfamily
MPIFSRYCEDGSIALFDEAKEMIDLMSGSGKTMAIASGTPAPDIRAVLRNAGAADVFETIVGSDVVAKVKPAPDIFLKTLEVLELAPRECLVFEDAEKGMYAAITAGIPVVVIRTPETRRFDFTRADLTVDSHSEMVRLLRKIAGEQAG